MDTKRKIRRTEDVGYHVFNFLKNYSLGTYVVSYVGTY